MRGLPAREIPAPPAPRTRYRFFELFDLPNIAGSADLLAAAADGRVRLTRRQSLTSRRSSGSRCFGCARCANSGAANSASATSRAAEAHPYTWILDPRRCRSTPSFPAWRSGGRTRAQQPKQRDLILKISGFSSSAGAAERRARLDAPQGEWQTP
jgi:hypothetical protein